MNLMLTDPDVLADYVNDFFGPNGPYPTPTNEELQQHSAVRKHVNSLNLRFALKR